MVPVLSSLFGFKICFKSSDVYTSMLGVIVLLMVPGLSSWLGLKYVSRVPGLSSVQFGLKYAF